MYHYPVLLNCPVYNERILTISCFGVFSGCEYRLWGIQVLIHLEILCNHLLP